MCLIQQFLNDPELIRIHIIIRFQVLKSYIYSFICTLVVSSIAIKHE